MIQNFQNSAFPQTPALPQYYVCETLHTIQTGDTLYSISQMHGVPVSVLMQTNNITNPYDLRVGQQICIPKNEASPGEITCDGFIHVIVAGDTPFLLARRYEVSLDSILQANPSIDPHNLMIGAQICIPGIRPAPAAPPSQPVSPETPAPPSIPAPSTMPPVVPPITIPTLPPMPMPMPTPEPPPMLISEPQPINTAPSCTGVLYVVKEGDTLYMIAKNHNVSLDELLKANPSLDLYNLEIGMALCIPGTPEAACPAPRREMPNREGCYYVRLNDNLDKICDRFQVLPRNLMKANPELNIIDYSTPGTRICIPNR